VLAQRFAEARDEKQGVVGGRSYHQDEHYSLALTVQRQYAAIGQGVDDGGRGGQRENR
jgi:hypothetical protein